MLGSAEASLWAVRGRPAGGLGQTRTSRPWLCRRRLDSGFSPGAGAPHPGKEEASAVLYLSPELHRAGGEDNNYWKRLKKIIIK